MEGVIVTAYKPNDVYHRKIRLKPFIVVPMAILLFCLAVFLMLFYGLQRYVVYEQDGVRIDFNKTEVTADTGVQLIQISTRDFSPVDIEIIYHDMDFTAISTNAGTEIESMQALYASAEYVTEANLATLATQAKSMGANALVLEMKGVEGVLGWNSSAPLATSFGTNGNMLLEEELTKLKDEGLYLVAEISCFVDGYMSMRNIPAALATSLGQAYTDDTGRWLDPTNPDVRDYIADLCTDLINQGFDEVLLDNFEIPQVADGTEFAYYQVGSIALTPEIVITSFAQTLRDEVEAVGGRLSVNCNANSFRNSLQSQTGQVASAFTSIFDRLYFPTDTNTVSSDMALFSAYLTQDELDTRFIPFMYGTDTASWLYPYVLYA